MRVAPRAGPMMLVVVLALQAELGATSTEEVTVTCPVCENKFLAEQWNSSNNIGGYDRDFLEHAAGGQVFIISCWTCPRCRYTGFARAFDAAKAPKELIGRLKKENPLRPAEPIDPKLGDSRKIPAWVRYDLLIQVSKLQPKTKPSQLGFLHLRTAHTQRFHWTTLDTFEKRRQTLWTAAGASLPKDLRGYDADIARAGQFEKLARDASSGIEEGDRPLAAVLAAVVYKSRGEDPDAERVLSTLAGKKLEPGLQAVIDDIKVRIGREKAYLKLAVPYLEEQIAEKGRDEKEVANVRFLLGVIHRKLGDKEKALSLLVPLLETEGIPDRFRDWIKDEVEKTRRG